MMKIKGGDNESNDNNKSDAEHTEDGKDKNDEKTY